MIDVLTDPQIWLVVLVISALGSLARLVNFYAGQQGKEKIGMVFTQIKPETWEKVLQQKHGTTKVAVDLWDTFKNDEDFDKRRMADYLRELLVIIAALENK